MWVCTKKVSELANAILNLVLAEINADDHPAKAARTELSTGAGEAREGFAIRVADDRFDELDREQVESSGVQEAGGRIRHVGWEDGRMGRGGS